MAAQMVEEARQRLIDLGLVELGDDFWRGAEMTFKGHIIRTTPGNEIRESLAVWEDFKKRGEAFLPFVWFSIGMVCGMLAFEDNGTEHCRAFLESIGCCPHIRRGWSFVDIKHGYGCELVRQSGLSGYQKMLKFYHKHMNEDGTMKDNCSCKFVRFQ